VFWLEKSKYIEAKIDCVLFEEVDVITGSDNTSDDEFDD
jgi:hypothetical protein